MKPILRYAVARGMAALFCAALLLTLSLGASAAIPVTVGTADQLIAALQTAKDDGENDYLIYFASSVGMISLNNASAIEVPVNATVDLSPEMSTLQIAGGVVSVYGQIVGGSIGVTGGTLVRMNGSSITAVITVGGTGAVRAPRTLSLENLAAGSTETIVAVTYRTGEIDTSSFINKSVYAAIYAKLSSGNNFSTVTEITTVVTDAGNVFRLGTRNTTTLSLAYMVTYNGLEGAMLTALNPSSYTTSDAAVLLNNPTKDGFVFMGWTCEALGLLDPTTAAVIPEGTVGALTFLANWMEEQQQPSGGGRTSSGGSSGTDTTESTDETLDAAALQEEAAAAEVPSTTSSSPRLSTGTSSTKVTFSSEVDVVMPTFDSVSQSDGFPWVWVLGGLAALGVAAYIASKLVGRKH